MDKIITKDVNKGFDSIDAASFALEMSVGAVDPFGITGIFLARSTQKSELLNEKIQEVVAFKNYYNAMRYTYVLSERVKNLKVRIYSVINTLNAYIDFISNSNPGPVKYLYDITYDESKYYFTSILDYAYPVREPIKSNYYKNVSVYNDDFNKIIFGNSIFIENFKISTANDYNDYYEYDTVKGDATKKLIDTFLEEIDNNNFIYGEINLLNKTNNISNLENSYNNFLLFELYGNLFNIISGGGYSINEQNKTFRNMEKINLKLKNSYDIYYKDDGLNIKTDTYLLNEALCSDYDENKVLNLKITNIRGNNSVEYSFKETTLSSNDEETEWYALEDDIKKLNIGKIYNNNQQELKEYLYFYSNFSQDSFNYFIRNHTEETKITDMMDKSFDNYNYNTYVKYFWTLDNIPSELNDVLDIYYNYYINSQKIDLITNLKNDTNLGSVIKNNYKVRYLNNYFKEQGKDPWEQVYLKNLQHKNPNDYNYKFKYPLPNQEHLIERYDEEIISSSSGSSHEQNKVNKYLISIYREIFNNGEYYNAEPILNSLLEKKLFENIHSFFHKSLFFERYFSTIYPSVDNFKYNNINIDSDEINLERDLKSRFEYFKDEKNNEERKEKIFYEGTKDIFIQKYIKLHLLRYEVLNDFKYNDSNNSFNELYFIIMKKKNILLLGGKIDYIDNNNNNYIYGYITNVDLTYKYNNFYSKSLFSNQIETNLNDQDVSLSVNKLVLKYNISKSNLDYTDKNEFFKKLERFFKNSYNDNISKIFYDNIENTYHNAFYHFINTLKLMRSNNVDWHDKGGYYYYTYKSADAFILKKKKIKDMRKSLEFEGERIYELHNYMMFKPDFYWNRLPALRGTFLKAKFLNVFVTYLEDLYWGVDYDSLSKIWATNYKEGDKKIE